MINMSIMGYLRLLGIWAIRRGLWTYVKMTMGCLGEGPKDPKKRGMIMVDQRRTSVGKWCQQLERLACKRDLCANDQRRPQVLGLVGLGTSTWRDWHARVCMPVTGGLWAAGLVGLNPSNWRDFIFFSEFNPLYVYV